MPLSAVWISVPLCVSSSQSLSLSVLLSVLLCLCCQQNVLHKLQIFDLWDFAGDEQHNIAHSYFISGRSIYLLVFNTCEDLEPQLKTLDYWMAAISVRAKGCPIVLVKTETEKRSDSNLQMHLQILTSSSTQVGTHKDLKQCDDALRDYVKQQLNVRYANRFPELKAIVFCSTKTGKHVSKVMESVRR